MAWKALAGQMVSAEMTPGNRETVRATDFDIETKAILVAWPKASTSIAGGVPFQQKTEIVFGRYEPWDADSWEWATRA